MSAANGQQPSVVATASADRTAMVWHLRGGEPMAVLRGHTNGLTSISLGAFTGTPLFAVTGSFDETVRTWDLTTGQQRDVLQMHYCFVKSVQLSSSGTKVRSRL